MGQQLCGHENATIIFILQPRLHSKNFESLFNTLLGQGGFICDEVGWWSGFNKGFDIINVFDVGLHNIVEGMGTNNQVDPSHGGPTGSSVIVVDGERIL